ncbi:branched-chain amino acid--2-keto-4-methylthiobutyrate aminotransferase, partial [Acinetobacter oleivorans]|nr:branched-chain amino acid--2-keto-4-methylthiobutyrate aminotransferase [Acinetobacter oleivorans]
GVKTHITKVKEEELLEADEAFTSSSAGGVMPIQTVDDVVLPVAPTNENSLAAKLHDLYWTKRWDGWLATKINYGS